MGNGIRPEDVHLADQRAKQSLERAHQACLKAAQHRPHGVTTLSQLIENSPPEHP